jgi:hypothetical protein
VDGFYDVGEFAEHVNFKHGGAAVVYVAAVYLFVDFIKVVVDVLEEDAGGLLCGNFHFLPFALFYPVENGFAVEAEGLGDFAGWFAVVEIEVFGLLVFFGIELHIGWLIG